MTNYEAWNLIIDSLNLNYEQEIFLKGMLYMMKDESSLTNPLVIKIIEFLERRH